MFHDNVIMFGPNGIQNLPRQGLFSSKSYGSGWDYEGNILMTNSLHGISAGPDMSSMRARNNTLIRGIDIPGEQRFVQFNLHGAIEIEPQRPELQRRLNCYGVERSQHPDEGGRLFCRSRLLYRALPRLGLL